MLREIAFFYVVVLLREESTEHVCHQSVLASRQVQADDPRSPRNKETQELPFSTVPLGKAQVSSRT